MVGTPKTWPVNCLVSLGFYVSGRGNGLVTDSKEGVAVLEGSAQLPSVDSKCVLSLPSDKVTLSSSGLCEHQRVTSVQELFWVLIPTLPSVLSVESPESRVMTDSLGTAGGTWLVS